MHRFNRNYYPFGIFFFLFSFFFGGLFYFSDQMEGVAWSFVVFSLVALPFFLFSSVTVFSDSDRSITNVSGFFPWRKTRQVLYQDVEKLVLTGRTTSTNSGSSSAQFDLKLFVKGAEKPIWVAQYGESDMRRDEPIVQAVAAAAGIPLEVTAGYTQTRERYDRTREGRMRFGLATMGLAVVCVIVSVYFAIAHHSPLPFHESIEPLFQRAPHKNNSTGEGIVVVGSILGVSLGMIGVGTYFQAK